MRRRALLATIGLAGTAGCLRTSEEADTTASETATATERPTASRTAADTEQPDETTTEPAGNGARSVSVQWRGPGSPIAVGDGVVYTYSGMELAARALESGTDQWRRDTDVGLVGRDTVSNGTLTDDTLYLAFRTGDGVSELRAVETASGEVLWETSIGGAARSIPLVAGQRLLLNVGGFDGEDGSDAILAYDRETGEQRWSRPAGTISAPGTRRLGTVDSAGNTYVTAGTAGLSAPVWKLDPAAGERSWEWGSQTPSSSPTYADGLALLGTYDGFVALDAGTGETQWAVETFDTNYEPPVVVGDTVYGGSRDTGVYAMALTDGTQRWRTQAAGGITALAATQDTVFAGYDGGLSLFEPDGTLATREQSDGGVDGLAISGELLVGNVGGDTVVYRVSGQ